MNLIYWNAVIIFDLLCTKFFQRSKNCCWKQTVWMSLWQSTVTVQLFVLIVICQLMSQVGEGKTGNWLRWSFHFSGRPHNPTSRFWSSQTSVVTAESLSDRPGPLWCVPQEMGFYRQRTVWLWRGPDNVTYRQLLSIDQVWRRSTALTWSGWGCRRLADSIMALSTR